MGGRVLAKAEWQGYCDRLSKVLLGKYAQLEVTGLTVGDQIAARWLPLLGITYDPKGDLLEIALEGLDHLIHRPRAISVDDGPEGLISMEIVDSDRRQRNSDIEGTLSPHRCLGSFGDLCGNLTLHRAQGSLDD